MEEKLKI